VIPGGWQQIPALIVLTVAVAAYRAHQGRSSTAGFAPSLVPTTPPVAVA